jgi:DNA-directed RNA polymerase specialized sigma subunit
LGKKKYINQDEVFNINDIDLNDPLHMRKCVEQWDSLSTLGDQYLKIKDLYIEMEERWNKASLTKNQRNSITLYLCQGYTQKESGETLGIGTRKVAQYVNEGITILAAYGDLDGRARQSA